MRQLASSRCFEAIHAGPNSQIHRTRRLSVGRRLNRTAPSMASQLLSLTTTRQYECIALTEAVRDFIRVHGERDEAMVIASQHTTTAVTLARLTRSHLFSLETQQSGAEAQHLGR